MVLRVAVIGAGAAGLVALRHLAARPDMFVPVAYEMTPHVAGTWVYTDRIGLDERGLHIQSSMYKNLRTNLPKEVMAFPDYPFPKELPSFIHHTEVRNYLEKYAKHFNLLQYINFSTIVDQVSPVATGTGSHIWDVVTSDVSSHKKNHSLQFDAVLVCNGHYATPLMPDLPGMDDFQGILMHSHNYRIPQPFKNKTVAILGAAASGQDMALDISTVAKHVYLLHNKPTLNTELPDNISQGLGIDKILGNSIILKDGAEIQVDAVLLCTGYRYEFPFLSPECQPNKEDERLTPLYKHIIHTKYPTLAIIGVCKHICPFPQFDCQVQFVLAALTGHMVLPSKEQMEADIAADFDWRTNVNSMPTRYAHKMGTLQWDYNDKLSELAAFEPIPKVIQTLYDHVHNVRVTNLPGYKNVRYELLSDTEFREIS